MAEYHYTIKSVLQNVSQLLAELKKKLVELNLDEKSIFALYLSLEEALVNAVKYGNKFNPDLTIDILLKIEPSQIVIQVSDCGSGFDYANIPDPTKDENIIRLGGRGVFLIKKYMDQVEFLNNGSTIKMTKRLK
jgi:serine/threonine-protein kinase RsbW